MWTAKDEELCNPKRQKPESHGQNPDLRIEIGLTNDHQNEASKKIGKIKGLCFRLHFQFIRVSS